MKKKNFLNWTSIIGAAAFISLLLFLGWSGHLDNLRGDVYGIISPAQAFLYRASGESVGYVRLIFSLNDLTWQNQELKEENLRLKADAVRFQEVMRENEFLRKQLDLSSLKSLNFILAKTIGGCAVSYSQCILINVGKNDGIVGGAAAIISGGVLVGEVVEVYDSTSRILLLDDVASAINVIAQKTRANGILRGDGDSLILEMVSPEQEIEIGEKIITAGGNDVFPRDLLVGEIEEIISKDAEASKRARVKSAANIQGAENVFIVIR